MPWRRFGKRSVHTVHKVWLEHSAHSEGQLTHCGRIGDHEPLRMQAVPPEVSYEPAAHRITATVPGTACRDRMPAGAVRAEDLASAMAAGDVVDQPRYDGVVRGEGFQLHDPGARRHQLRGQPVRQPLNLADIDARRKLGELDRGAAAEGKGVVESARDAGDDGLVLKLATG